MTDHAYSTGSPAGSYAGSFAAGSVDSGSFVTGSSGPWPPSPAEVTPTRATSPAGADPVPPAWAAPQPPPTSAEPSSAEPVPVDRTEPAADDADLDYGLDENEPQGEGLDMRVLVEWVDTHIASIVARKVPTTGGYPRWCRQWWFHAEAIVRFESLRHAWMDLIGRPGTAKLSYFRDFLDPTLMTLMADDGPFGRCTPTKHIDHDPIGQDVPPPELFD